MNLRIHWNNGRKTMMNIKNSLEYGYRDVNIYSYGSDGYLVPGSNVDYTIKAAELESDLQICNRHGEVIQFDGDIKRDLKTIII